MPDPLSPIQRTVMLRRVDPEDGMARFYTRMVERDLIATVRLMRHRARIGAMQRRELAQDFAKKEEAGTGCSVRSIHTLNRKAADSSQSGIQLRLTADGKAPTKKSGTDSFQ